jgi:NAD(P)-dependent dehydrogenase (short-subunit alcohol dehydrogenase family)
MRLDEARAVVTGGASGLGLAVTHVLHEKGARVAVLDLHEERRARPASLRGDEALFIRTDVTCEQGVERAMAHAAGQLGGISLVVNCAGTIQARRVLGRDRALSSAEFARILDVNLTGTFTVCRAAANAMRNIPPTREGERGVILNTASIAAFEGQVGQAAYAASKGGVVALTLPLAREFAHFGIRVMAIAPGIFETPLLDTLSEPAREHLVQSIPFPHRLGRPQEFAQLICHIYENPMLNGTVIRLDGALRMPWM